MLDVDDVPSIRQLEIDIIKGDILGASLGGNMGRPNADERLRPVDGCIERIETIDHGFEAREIVVIGDKKVSAPATCPKACAVCVIVPRLIFWRNKTAR